MMCRMTSFGSSRDAIVDVLKDVFGGAGGVFDVKSVKIAKIFGGWRSRE